MLPLRLASDKMTSYEQTFPSPQVPLDSNNEARRGSGSHKPPYTGSQGSSLTFLMSVVTWSFRVRQQLVEVEFVPSMTPIVTAVNCGGEKPAFYYPIPSSNSIL